MIFVSKTERRRQFCPRCGQQMFEFYRSPDGHFGIVGGLRQKDSPNGPIASCPACGGRFRLLDRVDATGQVIAKL